MNNIQYKPSNHEKISFAKRRVSGDNGILSQNTLAVKPYRQTWLFYCPNTGQSHPINKGFLPLYHLMGRLRLQNKPIGEYATWLLTLPRVRPPHPIFRVFTQNMLGVFPMNTIISNTIQKFAIFTPIESLVLGFVFGLPMACLVIAVLAVMGV